MEVVEDESGGTYRAIYTVKFEGIVYVLHTLQKKSKAGTRTPSAEIAKVRSRLKEAEKHYAEWSKQQKGQDEKDRGQVGPD